MQNMLFNEGTLIQIDRTKCLNYRHNGVDCKHCVSHCPSESLTLNHGGNILLQTESCLGCGLCFSDCPTEVFSAKQWDETSILFEVKKQDVEVTQFFCGRHDAPFLRQEDKAEGAIQLPTCLSSISKVAWYELGLTTKIELHLENCHACPMNATIERLQFSVDTAIEWLVASGHTPHFSYQYEAEEIHKKKKKLKAVSTGMRVTSRRDLFLSVFGPSKEVIRQIREKDFSSYATKRRKKKENRLSDWQKRLEQSYTSSFQEGGTPAYWPAIEKSESCVNCGMCGDNCPTEALQIKVEDQKAIHTFNSGHCLDCRLCMLFCPTESITRDRQPNPNPYEVQVIYEAPTIECRRCGDVSFDKGPKVCYWCENESLDHDMVADVWKHFG